MPCLKAQPSRLRLLSAILSIFKDGGPTVSLATSSSTLHPWIFFSFSLHLIRFPMSQLVPTASHHAPPEEVPQCKNLSDQGRSCQHGYADSDRQIFIPELQLRSFSSTIVITLTVCYCLVTVPFSLWNGWGIFASFAHLAALSPQIKTHWKTPLFFLTSQFLIKQVHSGHTPSPPAVASVMLQLAGRGSFSSYITLTLPYTGALKGVS